MAACAIGFTSCGNKSQQAVPVDDEVVAEAPAIDVEAIFSETTAQLTEQIEPTTPANCSRPSRQYRLR